VVGNRYGNTAAARRTWHTQVGGGQVSGEVVQTRSRLVHLCVRNAHRALAAAGTLSVQYLDDVGRTTDEAEVNPYAPTKSHPAVAC